MTFCHYFSKTSLVGDLECPFNSEAVLNFFKFFLNLQEHICATLLKKTLTQVFFSEFCETFKTTLFYELPPVAASVVSNSISPFDVKHHCAKNEVFH